MAIRLIKRARATLLSHTHTRIHTYVYHKYIHLMCWLARKVGLVWLAAFCSCFPGTFPCSHPYCCQTAELQCNTQLKTVSHQVERRAKYPQSCMAYHSWNLGSGNSATILEHLLFSDLSCIAFLKIFMMPPLLQVCNIMRISWHNNNEVYFMHIYLHTCWAARALSLWAFS